MTNATMKAILDHVAFIVAFAVISAIASSGIKFLHGELEPRSAWLKGDKARDRVEIQAFGILLCTAAHLIWGIQHLSWGLLLVYYFLSLTGSLQLQSRFRAEALLLYSWPVPVALVLYLWLV